MIPCADLVVSTHDPNIRFCGAAALSLLDAEGKPTEPVPRWIACWHVFLFVYSGPDRPDLAICLADASVAKKSHTSLALSSRGGTRATLLLESPAVANLWHAAIRQSMPKSVVPLNAQSRFIGSQTRDATFSAVEQHPLGLPCPDPPDSPSAGARGTSAHGALSGIRRVSSCGTASTTAQAPGPAPSPTGTASSRVLLDGSLAASVDTDYFAPLKGPAPGAAEGPATAIDAPSAGTDAESRRSRALPRVSGPTGAGGADGEDTMDQTAADAVLAAAFAHADRKVVTSVLANMEEEDALRLVEPLLAIFATHGCSLRLLEIAAEEETSSCSDPTLLLRSDSVYSRLLIETCRRAMQPFFQRLLAPVVTRFCDGEPDLEVDPSRLEAQRKTHTIRENQRALCDFVEEVLAALEGGMDDMPLVARHVCALLEAHCAKAASAAGGEADFAPGTATAALLSFRVLTPMLVTPSGHGLTAVRPTATTRRALMLASKVLHAAAVGMRFAEKEPFLTEVNDYIASTAPRWQQVWAQAAAPLDRTAHTDSAAGPARAEREMVKLLSTGDDVVRQYTKSLRRCLVRHADHIHHVLPSSSASGRHFDSALHDLVALSHTNPSPGDEGGVGAGGDGGRAGAGAAAAGGSSGVRGAGEHGKTGPVSWRAFQRMIVAQSRNLLGRPATSGNGPRRASDGPETAANASRPYSAAAAAAGGGEEGTASRSRTARAVSAPGKGAASGTASHATSTGKER